VIKYDLSTSDQVQHAIGVLKEYLLFHSKQEFKISSQLEARIKKTINLAESKITTKATNQLSTTKEEYFRNINSPFNLFSDSRKSIRNYSEEDIPIESIKSALNIVLNTPSACNRQTSRAYIFKNKNQIKEIIDIQGGAGGFGYLANKLVVITAELGVFGGAHERYQAYIDGGIFAMNMLYALHANSIACCILNCSNAPGKDKRLHKICEIDRNEVFIAMISCGYPTDNFSIATSHRYELNRICHIK
jgi:Nitroreductase